MAIVSYHAVLGIVQLPRKHVLQMVRCSPYRVADAKVLSTRRAYKQDPKSVDGKAFLDL